MLRKTLLALATSAVLGAAALSPTTASAAWGRWHGGGWHGGGWPGGWHGGWHGRYFGGPALRVYAGPVYGGCMVRRWVYTPYGPMLRWVNRCY